MKELIRKLSENGFEAYIVGGYVRDYLLGVNSTDIDISTNAPIEEIKRMLDGADFDIIGVYDDLSFSSVKEDSERAVFAARKR